MFNLIRAHQLNIMLLLCGACAIITFLLALTRFISESRKRVLIAMQLIAFFLLWFDRLAYIYAGDPSTTGYYMVRVSNFFVFFLTSGIVFGFNNYLVDWLTHEGGMAAPPNRLKFVRIASMIGMLLTVVSVFTNLYYTFDETNTYQRGRWFLISYIIPVVCPVIQYTVIRQNKKRFSRLIYTSLVLYIFVPIACGIIQIFTYGISIVNMAMVLVSIFLYVFTYLDINDTVERAHEIQIEHMQGEQARIQRLFDQTATAFVTAVEKKDELEKGNSTKVAEYAKRIAELSGKDAEECERVYYAALLHDIGLIGIPDKVIENDTIPGEYDYRVIRRKPLIGHEILSNISEFPYLGEGAHYSHERYNGTGYPEGLKGERIPEIARIIAVADAYVAMTTKKRYRGAKPFFVAREAFVKGSGEAFDPKFAQIMVRIIDEENGDAIQRDAEVIETEIDCHAYRDSFTNGIPIESEFTRVTFEASALLSDGEPGFAAPSIILFDAFDNRVHGNERAIEAYQYLEYGEVWFDEHSISTLARKIKEKVIRWDNDSASGAGSQKYEILMGRYEDHLWLKMTGPSIEKTVTVALPNSSKKAFIALTGENCALRNISVEKTGKAAGSNDIPRIANVISYIDRMESDIPNVQIDRPRSAASEGIEIKDRLTLAFHTMSLPAASLVWHCPYFVIFYSDDGQVGGKNYREYGLVKLHGENEGDTEFAQNSIITEKTEAFQGWDAWMRVNMQGMECEAVIRRKNNRITLKTVNLGIEMENTTIISDGPEKVFVALTGDQVAITDIRIR